jgi:hypothetical protein
VTDERRPFDDEHDFRERTTLPSGCRDYCDGLGRNIEDTLWEGLKNEDTLGTWHEWDGQNFSTREEKSPRTCPAARTLRSATAMRGTVSAQPAFFVRSVQAKIQRLWPNLPPRSHPYILDQDTSRSPPRFDHPCCMLLETFQQSRKYLHMTQPGTH